MRAAARFTRSAPTLLFMALAAVTACKGAENSNVPNVSGSDVGGTIIEAIPAEAHTLYPPAATDSPDVDVISAIFDHLADIGDGLNTVGDSGFVPQLASSWKWAKDSLSIAFSLNPKARWHDGVPVRAQDVKLTFKVYSDVKSGSDSPQNVANIDSVSIADTLTAVVWFKRRTPHQFFDATYQMYILPAHILDTVPAEKLTSHPFATAPVGTGRFRFSKWVKSQSLEIIADLNNYRGRAKIDRFIWAISDNAASASLSVFNGNADLFAKLTSDDAVETARYPKLRNLPYSEIGYSYLAFNFRARKNHSQPHPIFGDERVRRAFSMAVDRERLVQSVFDSFATVGLGPSPRAVFQDADQLKPIPFNLAHARALLDSAGWSLQPGQTVRSKNGVPLAFDIAVQSSSAPRKAYAEKLEQQFKLIGVKATARALQGQVMHAAVDAHDFDVLLFSYVLTPGLLGMPASWGTNGSGNAGTYSDPRFDATLDSALNAFKPGAARPLWLRAMQIITDDAAAVWLYEETNIALMHKRIRPTVLRHDAWYAHLADWTIDPAQRIARDRSPARGAN